MTLVELILAMTITAGVTVVIGHVITQMTSGAAQIEQKAQTLSETQLALLQMRNELRYATSITTLTATQVTFVSSDLTGDGIDDTVTYQWNGTAGQALTRRVNAGTAETMLDNCQSFNLGWTIGLVSLQAGRRYDIKMEFFENYGQAVAKLYWQSPRQSKEIVPQSRLYPTTTGNSGSPGSGTGLTGVYYDNSDFTRPMLTRVDSTINFNWGSGSPSMLIQSDTFSVRWTGQIEARYSDVYTFTTNSDDGVRLWVDNLLLIDNWTVHAATDDSGATGGPVDLIDLNIEAGTGAKRVRLTTSVQCINRPRVTP